MLPIHLVLVASLHGVVIAEHKAPEKSGSIPVIRSERKRLSMPPEKHFKVLATEFDVAKPPISFAEMKAMQKEEDSHKARCLWQKITPKHTLAVLGSDKEVYDEHFGLVHFIPFDSREGIALDLFESRDALEEHEAPILRKRKKEAKDIALSPWGPIPKEYTFEQLLNEKLEGDLIVRKVRRMMLRNFKEADGSTSHILRVQIGTETETALSEKPTPIYRTFKASETIYCRWQ